jgi:hypothetical protein
MRAEEEIVLFGDLCRILGKSPVYVLRLQQALDLYAPASKDGYTRAYVCFLEKIVALRTFGIPLADIADLFSKERRLLELLRFDALSDSPTWYLDGCGRQAGGAGDRLLLSGYCLGFSIDRPSYQPNLDFGRRDDHLFAGHEMGEDICRSLGIYREQAGKLCARIAREIPVLQNALYWGERYFERVATSTKSS